MLYTSNAICILSLCIFGIKYNMHKRFCTFLPKFVSIKAGRVLLSTFYFCILKFWQKVYVNIQHVLKNRQYELKYTKYLCKIQRFVVNICHIPYYDVYYETLNQFSVIYRMSSKIASMNYNTPNGLEISRNLFKIYIIQHTMMCIDA